MNDLAILRDMKADLDELLLHFVEVYGVKELNLPTLAVEFEPGPHTRPSPLKNEIGVYLFFRGSEWLRIGQTSYPQRFTSQHYGTRRAGSTLARDIWQNRNEFNYTGLENELDGWLLASLGRANIRLPKHHGDALSKLLEAFLQFNLRPKFEGRRNK